MGYQDRDYYKDDSTPSGIQVQSVVVKLIILNVAVFLLDLISAQTGVVNPAAARTPHYSHWLAEWLSLKGNAVAHPWMWYQFLTAGFVHDFTNLLHLVGNMIGLFCFGRALEDRLGGKEFLRFYLISIIFSFIVWSLRQYFLVGPIGENLWVHCLGASGGVTASILLFCLYYPRRTIHFMLFPAPAWLVGAILVVTNALGAKTPWDDQKVNVAFDVHLAGAAFAAAYWAGGWNFGKLPGMKELAALGRRLGKLLAPQPDLRIHDPNAPSEANYDNLDEQADRLLAKISEHGESSLTPQERRLLEDYSRRVRQKRR